MSVGGGLNTAERHPNRAKKTHKNLVGKNIKKTRKKEVKVVIPISEPCSGIDIAELRGPLQLKLNTQGYRDTGNKKAPQGQH